MSYTVKIQDFDGPLDLLLHLIKISEIDIYDISITDITKQYIDFIQAMEKMNLEVASEYLVMAADLVRIKSAMLLPKHVEIDEYVEEVDPKAELIDKLLIYKQYKKISEKLVDFKDEREKIFTKINNDDYEVEVKYVMEDNLDVFELLKALKKMQYRIEAKTPMTTVIEKHEVTVESRMVTLYEYILEKKSTMFSELFIVPSVSYIVTTFLAVLELVKEGKILVLDVVSDDFKVILNGGVNNE